MLKQYREGSHETATYIYPLLPFYTEGVVGSKSQLVRINLISRKVTQLTDNGSNYAGNWFAPQQLCFPVNIVLEHLVEQCENPDEIASAVERCW